MVVGKGVNTPKRLWRERGGATRIVGEDWADGGNIAENQGSGGVDKGGGDSSSLILEG